MVTIGNAAFSLTIWQSNYILFTHEVGPRAASLASKDGVNEPLSLADENLCSGKSIATSKYIDTAPSI
jgi:hypothetical protein